jgi:hypothetical protein
MMHNKLPLAYLLLAFFAIGCTIYWVVYWLVVAMGDLMPIEMP